MTAPAKPSPSVGFERLERLAPLGYFAMGVGWLRVASGESRERMLAIANGSDWTPQPLTLHSAHPTKGFHKLPCWFSEDYDHHMGLAVGDLTGNGFDDVVVAVFAGKNQDLRGGGIKVYPGGPEGLNPRPYWLAQGFAATGVALADLRGTGKLDIVVSCLCEAGTIQAPAASDDGRFEGRARLLVNDGVPGVDEYVFEEHLITREGTQGAGDVAVADVNLTGTLDVIFAGHRTTVLYGTPDTHRGEPWAQALSWTSSEEHPFSFSAQAFLHPQFPGRQLIASSRGLFSAAQLQGRSLAEVAPGILIHDPIAGGESEALQALAPVRAQRPEVPAGLTVTYDDASRPCLVVGFLDARSKDIRGAPLRVFRSEICAAPDAFDDAHGTPLPGGGLMAGRVATSPYAEGPTSISEWQVAIEGLPKSVLTLPWRPAGDLLDVRVRLPGEHTKRVSFTRTSDGAAICFCPPLPAGAAVSISIRTAEQVEIVATSSAAWPPAGASGVWRGRFPTKNREAEDAAPSSVRQAG